MVYGYHRTSTKDQHLGRGIKEISVYCEKNNLKLEKIYTDQHTGKDFNRPRFTVLRDDVLRPGDTLIITEVDRLGRNKGDVLKQLNILKKKKVRIMILEIPTTLMDLGILEESMARMILETVNNLLIEVYATMAQAEMEKKEKRQKEGIQDMKARGDWDRYGRPPVISIDEFRKEYKKVEKKECTPKELMNQLNMKKPTYYRYRERILEEQNGSGINKEEVKDNEL
ncbi:resolvase [Lachnospiraceae bacterium]|nr:resolvase [Lachnospiraceae bacterium]GKH41233.1 resolvase [Lachnospiraceae bacterium]